MADLADGRRGCAAGASAQPPEPGTAQERSYKVDGQGHVQIAREEGVNLRDLIDATHDCVQAREEVSTARPQVAAPKVDQVDAVVAVRVSF